MLFNSYLFILFFLPASLLLYFGLNTLRREREAKVLLILMSLWFYAYFHIGYLVIILFSVLINYGISKILLRLPETTKRKWILSAGIAGNVGVIFYFKYFNFFLENMNYLFHTSFLPRNILMPLGISFFTFQQISYLVDSYRRETAGYGFIDYALFVTYFPQLIAGPIVTHDEMIPQFQDPERRKFSPESFARGLHCFAIGLAKKVLLADTLAPAVDWAFGNPRSLSALGTFVLSLLYVFQLYFDFSGYCDMACGIANMFHLELPINFNSPYKAASISDFWKRWHMSLIRFLRKYVYFPLGGSRKGPLRAQLNILVVFLVSGIWHGANWTYILWGCVCGISQVINNIFEKPWNKIPRPLRRLTVFLFFAMSCLLFRSNSLADCGVLFSNMLSGKPGGVPNEMLEAFDVIEFTYLEDHIGFLGNIAGRFPSIHMWIVLGAAFLIAFLGKNCYEQEFRPSGAKALKCVILLVWAVMSLSGLSIFLYFNF